MIEPLPPSAAPAAGREVAVTFDDLPAVCVTRGDLATHLRITIRLVDSIASHGVPAVGFVNERKLLSDGVLDEARVSFLRRWLDAGLELGNHTFAHLDLHRTPLGRFEEDVIRGEAVTRDLLQARGMTLRYFRHPFLHTGTHPATKRRLEDFLAGHGYRVAPVTVYTEDYLFAAAYDRALQRGDQRTARQVAAAYVPYVERQLAYYERLSRSLLGHELRQILVLHANSINAETFDQLAPMMKARGYAFIPLERALADDAYATPDTYVGSEGISWLQRWALTRGLEAEELEGEPVTPSFVRRHSGVGTAGTFMRWWSRCVARANQPARSTLASAPIASRNCSSER